MIDPRWEEQAALAALGWADDPVALDRAAAIDSEIAGVVRGFADAAAVLAHDAPQRAAPAELRARVFASAGLSQRATRPLPAAQRSTAPASAPARTGR